MEVAPFLSEVVWSTGFSGFSYAVSIEGWDGA